MFAGEKVNVPAGPTSTFVFLNPPMGFGSGGEMLGVEATLASSLKAANDFSPTVGLILKLMIAPRKGPKISRINRVEHARLTMISGNLPTVEPQWLCVLDFNCKSSC